MSKNPSEIFCVAIRNADNGQANERTDGRKFRVGAKLGKFTRAESENSADITDESRGTPRPEIVLRFVLRSDRYPIECRMGRTRLIRRSARSKLLQWCNRRDQHSQRGDRTARRSGKLFARKQDHLSECIALS